MNDQIMIDVPTRDVAAAGIGLGMLIFYAILYVFFAFCLARLATKQGMSFGSSFVWALIPIANVFLFLKLGGKPMWWFILLLIPILNIIMAIFTWMGICEKLGKPGWWGIMIGIVPFANIVFFLMLVFGRSERAPATA